MTSSRSFQKKVEDILDRLHSSLGDPYVTRREFKASALHWPDVVWFDRRVPDELMPRRLPGVPVLAFEIESSSSLQSIKGAINNLEALSPALGCIVIPAEVARKARTIEIDIYGKTFGEAVQYVADRSPVMIRVLTEEDLRALTSKLQRHS